jgi:hypothetical protein
MKKLIFGSVPIHMLKDKRLGLNDLRVYIALSSYQGDKEDCFPSLKKISERCGVHSTHIPKHTNKLEELGYIEKTRRGKRISNNYVVRDWAETYPHQSSGEYAEPAKSPVSEYANPAWSDYAEAVKSDYAEPAYSNIIITKKITMEITPTLSQRIQKMKNIWMEEHKRLTDRHYVLQEGEEDLLGEISEKKLLRDDLFPTWATRFISAKMEGTEDWDINIRSFYQRIQDEITKKYKVTANA